MSSQAISNIRTIVSFGSEEKAQACTQAAVSCQRLSLVGPNRPTHSVRVRVAMSPRLSTAFLASYILLQLCAPSIGSVEPAWPNIMTTVHGARISLFSLIQQGHHPDKMESR